MHHVLASALVGLAVWAAPSWQAVQADFDAQSITVVPGIPEVIPSTSPPPEVPAEPIPAPAPRAVAEPSAPMEGPVRAEAAPAPEPVQEVQAQEPPAAPAAAPAPAQAQVQAPAPAVPAAAQPSLRSEPRPSGGKRVAAFWMMLPGRS